MAAFEERLTALAGEDALKEGKQLLKQHRLCGAWRDNLRRICGVFRDGNAPAVTCKVQPGDEPLCECSRCQGGRLCAHGVALLMYSGRFHAASEIADPAPSYYGGLRKQELAQLAERGRRGTAKLRLNVVSTSPHAPCKWENMILSVRLITPSREYTGNQNNLRQLYFDKSLSVVLKFDDFSLHDQQLIRFLALNGEAENSNVVLNSEETAEFFHALPGFPRFFRDGHRIMIHRECAEAVLISSGNTVVPGLRVNGAALAFAGAKIIAGKAGCWVGKEDEYFFIGGNCEIGFLRSFFRAPAQNRSGFADFPLPVVPATGTEPAVRQAGVMLDGCWPADGKNFELHYEYLYRVGGHGVFFQPGTGTLSCDGKDFWKRDRKYEADFETELALFGCELAETGGTAHFADAECAMLFLDRALPEILARRPEAMLSAQLASLLCGRGGIPEVELHCRYAGKSGDAFLIDFDLLRAHTRVDWEQCAECATAGGEFLNASGAPGRLSMPLAVFLRAAPAMLRKLDPAGRTFELPFCNVSYYCQLVRELPSAMVPEILEPLPVSAPDVQGEHFTFKGELRNYQKEGVAFLQTLADRNFNALLADEMGLGKTVQLLALLASRLCRGGAPALIVCPASLVVNWQREANRFVPDLRVAAPQGNSRNAVIGESGSYDLLILSYAAARLSAKFLKRIRFAFLVLDEAQHIKNPGSGNAKNCKELPSLHRIVLSGTPLENSPDDLWSVMDFLQPGMLGSLSAFRRRYAAIASSPELQRDLTLRTAPFIKRRTKKEVAADLPERSENLLFCDFGAEQRALYEKVRAEGQARFAAAGKDEKRCGAELFATLLRLRQICCHPALLPGDEGSGIPSAKSELLLELLHETIDSGHKVLLFSQFTSMLKLLIPELEKAGVPFEYLDGSVRNRQQKVDHFNDSPEIPLFLLSLKAGGTGLNLTAADTVIIYDPWWNPAVELQAADRSHRIGQTRAVSIAKMVVHDSIEEKILSLQARKRELFFNLIENPAAGGGLSLDELRSLLE